MPIETHRRYPVGSLSRPWESKTAVEVEAFADIGLVSNKTRVAAIATIPTNDANNDRFTAQSSFMYFRFAVTGAANARCSTADTLGHKPNRYHAPARGRLDT